jgi:hypothetical protein
MMGLNRQTLGWLARHAAYVALMLSVYGAIALDLRAGETPRPPATRTGELLPETPAARLVRLQQVGKFNEDGVLESLELALLFTIGLAGLGIAGREPAAREVALLLAGWAGLGAIREQDQWFDQFAHGCWIVPAVALAVAMAIFAWRHRRPLAEQVVAFVHAPSWGLFVAGGLMSLVFARLKGQGAIWTYLVEDPRLARNLKNMVEESLETAGYMLLVCGLFEWIVHLRRRRNSAPGGCNFKGMASD